MTPQLVDLIVRPREIRSCTSVSVSQSDLVFQLFQPFHALLDIDKGRQNKGRNEMDRSSKFHADEKSRLLEARLRKSRPLKAYSVQHGKEAKGSVQPLANNSGYEGPKLDVGIRGALANTPENTPSMKLFGASPDRIN